MAKQTQIDIQWTALMALCESEARFKSQGNHPKVLKLVTAAIRDLAGHMGFSERQIRTREFRAERVRGHIVRIVIDGKAQE